VKERKRKRCVLKCDGYTRGVKQCERKSVGGGTTHRGRSKKGEEGKGQGRNENANTPSHTAGSVASHTSAATDVDSRSLAAQTGPDRSSD